MNRPTLVSAGMGMAVATGGDIASGVPRDASFLFKSLSGVIAPRNWRRGKKISRLRQIAADSATVCASRSMAHELRACPGMDQSLLTAAAGLRARLEALELVANNVANVSTAGFKADREFYNLFVAAEAEANAAGDLTWMPVVEGSAIDFRQGVLARTGAPLDLALEGPGFFAVAGPQGTLYTRNGSFRRSRDGRLATVEGYAVLGDSKRPIDLPAGEIKVSEDGTVWAAQQAVGRLQLVEFANKGALGKVGHSYFRGAPAPGAAGRTAVAQGQLESANVNPAEAAVRLIEVSRGFEMLTRAVSLVANEMNRRAIEEIPRTGS